MTVKLKVVAGLALAAVGLAIYLVAPSAAYAALPLLIVAAFLSMVFRRFEAGGPCALPTQTLGKVILAAEAAAGISEVGVPVDLAAGSADRIMDHEWRRKIAPRHRHIWSGGRHECLPTYPHACVGEIQRISESVAARAGQASIRSVSHCTRDAGRACQPAAMTAWPLPAGLLASGSPSTNSAWPARRDGT